MGAEIDERGRGSEVSSSRLATHIASSLFPRKSLSSQVKEKDGRNTTIDASRLDGWLVLVGYIHSPEKA